MKRIYFFLVLFICSSNVFAQIDIPIGTGNTGNYYDQYPCPLQDYFEGSRAQYLFKASELIAAGMTIGEIHSVKFNVLSLNGFSGKIDGLTIKLKSTSTSSLSATWENGATTYFGQVDYVPVVGINTFTLSSPFFWNGADNIIVEVCNGSLNSSWTANVSIPMTLGLAFNGSHTYRADSQGLLCNTSLNSLLNNIRPNIIFNFAPASGCIFPMNLEISNTNAFSAAAQWKSYPFGTAPFQFLWEVRTGGLPWSGAAGLTAGGSTADSSIIISGLQPGTNYKLYVRSVCSASDTSGWIGIDFVTNCLPRNPPYIQDFENSDFLPICTKTQNFGGSKSWAIVNNPGFHFTNRALAVQSTLNYDTDSWFYTPALHLNGGVTYRLTFKYGASYGTHKLEVKYGKGARVNAMSKLLVDLPGIVNGPANHSIIEFTPTDTGIYNVGFHAYSGKSSYFLFLDNINISKVPVCERFKGQVKILNVSANSATLQWNANNPAPSGYDIYYTTSAIDVPVKTTTPKLSVVDTMVTLSGLSPQTKYFCYLRSTCGSSHSSPWTKVENIVTLCTPVTVPYSVNFESSLNLPACTDEKRLNGGKKWVVKNDPYRYFKSNALYAPTDNADTWFFIRGIMLQAGTSYRLSFKYIDAMNSPNSREQLRVKYGTSMEVSAMNNLIVEYDSIHNGYIETSNTDFIPAVSGLYYIGFQAYRNAGTGSLIGIDDIEVTETPVCDVPAKVKLRSLTGDQVVFSWSPPGITSPARYHIYYSTSGNLPADTVQPILFTADTLVTIKGLASSTKYYFYIRSGCGTSGKSSWLKMGEYTTACGLQTLPYKVDFQPGVTCISFFNGIKGGNWINTYFGIRGNSMQSQYSNENFPNNNWFFTGGIQLTAGKSYRIKFLYSSRYSYPCNLEVMYGGGADPASMLNGIVNLTGLKSVYSASSLTDFIPATSGTYYFGFHDYSPPYGYYLTVDDIIIAETPSCDIPVNVIKSDTTSNSIQLRWSKPLAGIPSSYQIYYTTSDTIPDSSTIPSVVVTDTFAILTGLKSNANYNYYIRTNCGGGDFSEWTSKDMFKTFCSATKVPFKDDFENSSSIPGCSVTNTGAGSSIWSIVNNPGYGFTNRTLSIGYSSKPDAWYFVRKVKLTGGVSYRLKFRYGNNSTNYKEKLEVKLGEKQNPLFMSTLLWKNDSIRFASARNAQVDFSASTTGEYTIGFHAMSDPYQYRLFVDDIELIETPTCDVPQKVSVSKITSSSFKLTWSAPLTGTPVNYAIYYSTADTFPIKATVPDTSIADTTLVISGLQPATKYYYTVRAQCGGADKGLWTVLDSFVTACLPAQVPYAIDFEGSSNAPECTSIINNGTGSIWKIISSPGFGFTSKAIFLQYNNSSKANTWFFTRSVHLTAGKSYRLSFRYGTNYPSTAVEKLRIKYGKTADASAMINLVADYASISNLGATKSITDFTSSATGDYVFGFYAYSNKAQGNLYLDDISIEVSPDCDIPMNITDTVLGSSVVQLSWSKSRRGTNTGYHIYYDTLNVRPTANAQPTLSVTDTTATITGLLSATKYYYWLRTNCDTAGNSVWSGTNNFTTDVSRNSSYAKSDQIPIGIRNPAELEIKNLYPNPVTSMMNVVVISPVSEKISLQLVDIAGKVVLSTQRQVIKGEQNVVINVSNISEGTYLLKVFCQRGCDKAVFKFRKR